MKRLLLFVFVLLPLSAFAFTPEMILEVSGGSHPVVEGRTNMPEGTAISVLVKVPGRYGTLMTTNVASGEFSIGPLSKEDGGPLPSGRGIVEVTSALPQLQPASVRAVIGENGEAMTGPSIYSLPGISGRMVKFTADFDMP